MKKFLAMALALLMVAVLLPVTAMAETTTVANLEGLKAALEKGESTIILSDDITTDGIQIGVTSKTSINFNGNTLTGAIESGSNLQIDPNVNLVLSDPNNSGDYSIDGKIVLHEGGGMTQFAAIAVWKPTVTIESGKYTHDNIVVHCQLQTQDPNAVGVVINGGTFDGQGAASVIRNDFGNVIINNGTFNAFDDGDYSGECLYVDYGNSYVPSITTINGGTFNAVDRIFYVKVNAKYTQKIIINDGTFNVAEGGSLIEVSSGNASDYLTITGGTFNINPAKYVAAGCPVTKNADGKYVVGANDANHGNTAVANTEVSISKESMTATGATETTLKVNETTSVTFDNAAMGTISSQAGNADYVTLEVKVGVEAPQDVKTAYETATKDTNANCVFTVDLVGIKDGEQTKLFTAPADGTTIGTATVRFQYEKNAKDVKCYYLSGGSMVEINGDNFTYDSSTGMVTVKLNHFSTYVVTGNTSTGAGSITIIVPDDTTDTTTTTETTKNPTTGMNDFVSAAIAVAAVSLLGMAAVLRKK